MTPLPLHLSEGALYALIQKRYAAPSWAVMPGVANATGSGARRTCDALAMGLWPSRGLELIGFECKSHRSDWLRELKNPEKAEPVAKFCDRWFIVAANAQVVKPEEVPALWGLLVAEESKLVLAKDAGARESAPMTRAFLASILRGAHKHVVDTDTVQTAVNQAIAETRTRLGDQHRRDLDLMTAEHAGLERNVKAFNEALGLGYGTQLDAHGYGLPPQALGRAVKFVLDGGLPNMRRELENTHRRLTQLTASVAELLADSPAERAAALASGTAPTTVEEHHG